MRTIEYKSVDKNTWGPGPWQEEPDKIQFEDPATKLPCLIVRNMAGALCGYVGVPKSHPWHGKGYDDVEANAHGGLTFSGPCVGSGTTDEEWRSRVAGSSEARAFYLPTATLESSSICHLVEQGEDDDVWWLGFDCAHCYDAMPAMAALLSSIPGRPKRNYVIPDEVYRDMAYVKAEIASLAQQAVLAGGGLTVPGGRPGQEKSEWQ